MRAIALLADKWNVTGHGVYFALDTDWRTACTLRILRNIHF